MVAWWRPKMSWKLSQLPFWYVLEQNETDLRIATGEPGVERQVEEREKVLQAMK